MRKEMKQLKKMVSREEKLAVVEGAAEGVEVVAEGTEVAPAESVPEEGVPGALPGEVKEALRCLR